MLGRGGVKNMVKNITKSLLPAVLQYAQLGVKAALSQVQVLQDKCMQRVGREEASGPKLARGKQWYSSRPEWIYLIQPSVTWIVRFEDSYHWKSNIFGSSSAGSSKEMTTGAKPIVGKWTAKVSGQCCESPARGDGGVDRIFPPTLLPVWPWRDYGRCNRIVHFL